MIYGPPFFLTGTLAALVIFFALVMGGPEQQPCTVPDQGSIPIPNGYTAHLEGPQLAWDRNCKVFAATRPNSSVGGLVWTLNTQGQPEILLTIDPRKMYALGTFAKDPAGRLMYVTVPDPDPNSGGDNTTLDYYLVPEYVP